MDRHHAEVTAQFGAVSKTTVAPSSKVQNVEKEVEISQKISDGRYTESANKKSGLHDSRYNAQSNTFHMLTHCVGKEERESNDFNADQNSTPQVAKAETKLTGATKTQSRGTENKRFSPRGHDSTMASPDRASNNSQKKHSFRSPQRRSDGNRSNCSHSSERRDRSANRRSYSTDPDSGERAFTYPCQAFKQFLLSMREGNLSLADLQNQQHLVEYMNYQGERRSAKTKPFEQSLRSSSQEGRESSSKHQLRYSKAAKGSQKLGEAQSIIEEDEDEFGNHTKDTTDNRKHKFQVSTNHQSQQQELGSKQRKDLSKEGRKDVYKDSHKEGIKDSGIKGKVKDGSRDAARDRSKDTGKDGNKEEGKDVRKSLEQQRQLDSKAKGIQDTTGTAEDKLSNSQAKQRRFRRERSGSKGSEDDSFDQSMDKSDGQQHDKANEKRFDDKGKLINIQSQKQDEKDRIKNIHGEKQSENDQIINIQTQKHGDKISIHSQKQNATGSGMIGNQPANTGSYVEISHSKNYKEKKDQIHKGGDAATKDPMAKDIKDEKHKHSDPRFGSDSFGPIGGKHGQSDPKEGIHGSMSDKHDPKDDKHDSKGDKFGQYDPKSEKHGEQDPKSGKHGHIDPASGKKRESSDPKDHKIGDEDDQIRHKLDDHQDPYGSLARHEKPKDGSGLRQSDKRDNDEVSPIRSEQLHKDKGSSGHKDESPKEVERGHIEPHKGYQELSKDHKGQQMKGEQKLDKYGNPIKRQSDTHGSDKKGKEQNKAGHGSNDDDSSKDGDDLRRSFGSNDSKKQRRSRKSRSSSQDDKQLGAHDPSHKHEPSQKHDSSSFHEQSKASPTAGSGKQDSKESQSDMSKQRPGERASKPYQRKESPHQHSQHQESEVQEEQSDSMEMQLAKKNADFSDEEQKQLNKLMKSPGKQKVYKEDLNDQHSIEKAAIESNVQIYDQQYESDDSNKGIQDRSSDGSAKVPGIVQVKKTPARESRKRGSRGSPSDHANQEEEKQIKHKPEDDGKGKHKHEGDEKQGKHKPDDAKKQGKHKDGDSSDSNKQVIPNQQRNQKEKSQERKPGHHRSDSKDSGDNSGKKRPSIAAIKEGAERRVNTDYQEYDPHEKLEHTNEGRIRNDPYDQSSTRKTPGQLLAKSSSRKHENYSSDTDENNTQKNNPYKSDQRQAPPPKDSKEHSKHSPGRHNDTGYYNYNPLNDTPQDDQKYMHEESKGLPKDQDKHKDFKYSSPEKDPHTKAQRKSQSKDQPTGSGITKDPSAQKHDPKSHQKDQKYNQNDPQYQKNDPKFYKNDPKYHRDGPEYYEEDPNYHEHDPKSSKNDPRKQSKEPRYNQNDPRSYQSDPRYYQNVPRQHYNDPKQNDDSSSDQSDSRRYQRDPRSDKNYPRNYSNDPRSHQKDHRRQSKEPMPDQYDPRSERDDPRSYQHDPRDYPNDPRSQQHDQRSPYKNDPRYYQNDPRDYYHDPRDYQRDPRDYQHDPRDYQHDPRNYQKDPRSQSKDPYAQRNDPYKHDKYYDPKSDRQKDDYYSSPTRYPKDNQQDKRDSRSPLKDDLQRQKKDSMYDDPSYGNDPYKSNKYPYNQIPITKEHKYKPTQSANPTYQDNSRGKSQPPYPKEYTSNKYQYPHGDPSKYGKSKKNEPEKEHSKLRELERRLRDDITNHPERPLDYQLLFQIQEEAARTIQIQVRQKILRVMYDDEAKRHGNMCDRKVQTDTLKGLYLHDRLSTDMFKRFFFAVFYTYIMMNTIMAGALPDKKQKK